MDEDDGPSASQLARALFAPSQASEEAETTTVTKRRKKPAIAPPPLALAATTMTESRRRPSPSASSSSGSYSRGGVPSSSQSSSVGSRSPFPVVTRAGSVRSFASGSSVPPPPRSVSGTSAAASSSAAASAAASTEHIRAHRRAMTRITSEHFDTLFAEAVRPVVRSLRIEGDNLDTKFIRMQLVKQVHDIVQSWVAAESGDLPTLTSETDAMPQRAGKNNIMHEQLFGKPHMGTYTSFFEDAAFRKKDEVPKEKIAKHGVSNNLLDFGVMSLNDERYFDFFKAIANEIAFNALFTFSMNEAPSGPNVPTELWAPLDPDRAGKTIHLTKAFVDFDVEIERQAKRKKRSRGRDVDRVPKKMARKQDDENIIDDDDDIFKHATPANEEEVGEVEDDEEEVGDEEGDFEDNFSPLQFAFEIASIASIVLKRFFPHIRGSEFEATFLNRFQVAVSLSEAKVTKEETSACKYGIHLVWPMVVISVDQLMEFCSVLRVVLEAQFKKSSRNASLRSVDWMKSLDQGASRNGLRVNFSRKFTWDSTSNKGTYSKRAYRLIAMLNPLTGSFTTAFSPDFIRWGTILEELSITSHRVLNPSLVRLGGICSIDSRHFANELDPCAIDGSNETSFPAMNEDGWGGVAFNPPIDSPLDDGALMNQNAKGHGQRNIGAAARDRVQGLIQRFTLFEHDVRSESKATRPWSSIKIRSSVDLFEFGNTISARLGCEGSVVGGENHFCLLKGGNHRTRNVFFAVEAVKSAGSARLVGLRVIQCCGNPKCMKIREQWSKLAEEEIKKGARSKKESATDVANKAKFATGIPIHGMPFKVTSKGQPIVYVPENPEQKEEMIELVGTIFDSLSSAKAVKAAEKSRKEITKRIMSGEIHEVEIDDDYVPPPIAVNPLIVSDALGVVPKSLSTMYERFLWTNFTKAVILDCRNTPFESAEVQKYTAREEALWIGPGGQLPKPVLNGSKEFLSVMSCFSYRREGKDERFNTLYGIEDAKKIECLAEIVAPLSSSKTSFDAVGERMHLSSSSDASELFTSTEAADDDDSEERSFMPKETTLAFAQRFSVEIAEDLVSRMNTLTRVVAERTDEELGIHPLDKQLLEREALERSLML
mgnify:CR=1 FL=1